MLFPCRKSSPKVATRKRFRRARGGVPVFLSTSVYCGLRGKSARLGTCDLRQAVHCTGMQHGMQVSRKSHHSRVSKVERTCRHLRLATCDLRHGKSNSRGGPKGGVRVEVHLETKLEPRPVVSVLVHERRSAVVVSMMIAPVGRRMGHGGLGTDGKQNP